MAKRKQAGGPHRPGPAAGAAAGRHTRGAGPARRSRDLRAAGAQDGPGGPAAWLGAFSRQDGPAALALAVLVAVSYFPACRAASCGTT